MSHLARLEHFDISENPLEDVREIFLKKRLTTLRMNNAGFVSFFLFFFFSSSLFTPSLFTPFLPALSFFFLIKPIIGLRSLPSNIPSELAGRLTVISLQGNKLMTFPNALLACRSLMVLLVNNNLLESIPFEICRLVNLKRLAISGNNLVTLTRFLSFFFICFIFWNFFFPQSSSFDDITVELQNSLVLKSSKCTITK